MKKRALFRDASAASEPLAMDPAAFGLMFWGGCEAENVTTPNGVTVVTIDGPLVHKSSWWDSYEQIGKRTGAALDDPETVAVVLRIDSPGGECAGLFELVRSLREKKAATGKPVYAYVDEGAYSAAYALATIADEIYLPEAGGVGSIGVISMALDMTARDQKDGFKFTVVTSGKRKSDGNPHVPITDAAIARDQERVDQLAAMFFEAVSEARGLTPKKIAGLEANTFYGEDAIKVGLADGVMSFADVVRYAGNPIGDVDGTGLSSVQTSNNVDRPVGRENAKMAGMLALTKAVNEAKAAVAAATTDPEKKAARKLLASAEEALEAGDAKITKVKTTDKTVHTEETDDGKDASDDDDDKDDDDKDDDDKDDDDDDDDDKDDAKALLSLCRRITGKASHAEIVGALEGLAEAGKKQSKTSARLARLESDSRQSKIDAMVRRGKASGQITPGNEAKVRNNAAEMGPKWLAAYLDTAPKAVASEAKEGKLPTAGTLEKPTADMIKIWKKSGLTEKDFPAALENWNRAQAAHGEIVQ